MPETRRALRLLNWNFGLRWVCTTVTANGGMAVTAFALAVGIAKEQMGLLATALSFACVAQLIGIPILNRLRNKKRLAVVLTVAEPCVLLSAFLSVPLLSPGLRLPVLSAALFLAASVSYLNMPVTENWLSMTLPGQVRGRYFGRRAQVMCVTGSVSIMILGGLIRWVGQGNTWGLAVLLAVGALLGMTSAIPLAYAAIPPLVHAARVNWQAFREVPRNRAFRRLVAAGILFSMPNLLVAPYIQVFHVRVLNMSETHVAAIWVMYYVVRFFVAPVCGRYLDRIGARRMLYLASCAYGVYILAYPLSTPDRTWPIFVSWLAAAFGDAGGSIAFNSTLYSTLPPTSSRPAYFITNTFVTAGISGFGTLLSVRILSALQGVEWVAGSMHFGQFHLYFLGCVAWLVCLGIPAVRLVVDTKMERGDR